MSPSRKRGSGILVAMLAVVALAAVALRPVLEIAISALLGATLVYWCGAADHTTLPRERGFIAFGARLDFAPCSMIGLVLPLSAFAAGTPGRRS